MVIIVALLEHLATLLSLTARKVSVANTYRLVALISYPDGADPEALTRDFMASPEFAADPR
jgi:hypothetical protein